MALGLGSAEVKRVRALQRDGDLRDAEGVFILEGERMLREALSCGVTIEAVYVPEGASGPSGMGVNATWVTERAFRSMSDTVSGSSLVAVAVRPDPGSRSAGDFVAVLDGISDPGNLGTLIRSAEAAGADMVMLVGACADPWSSKVVRSSAGSVFLVPVMRATWDQVARNGRTVLGLTAATGDSTVELGAVVSGGHWKPGTPVAVVVGNETRGVSPDAPVSVWVRIAHRGRTESLNAAMAGTVAFMHLSRESAEGEK